MAEVAGEDGKCFPKYYLLSDGNFRETITCWTNILLILELLYL